MKRALLCSVALFFCLPVLAQQQDISRYTLFTGFDYMISPARNLTERGFEADFGVTVKPWLALGGDFSAIGEDVLSGAGTVSGGETIYAPILNPILPGGANSVKVPFKSTTFTFAAGPQFYLRKWDKVTLFARPGLGGIHEVADFTFPAQLAPLFIQLGIPIPPSHQTDTTWFVGVGGGFDVNVTKRVGVRFATDYVNTHLFTNLLTSRQNYLRFSVGPTFHFGHYEK